MDSLLEQLMTDPWGRLILHYLVSGGLSDFLGMLLVGGRFVGLLFVAPQLVRCPIPYSIRVGLVVVMSLVVAPAVASKEGPSGDIIQLAYQSISTSTSHGVAFDFGTLIAGEVALGTLIGVCLLTFFSGLKMAGTWLERHGGLGQGSVVNPDWFAGDSAPGTFVQILGILTLILVDPTGGHWPLLHALLRSFELIPVGAAISSLPLSQLLSTVLQQSMLLGIRIAMPLLITMSFVDATLVFASRSGPQFSTSNFVVIRLIVGTIALGLTMTTIPDVVGSLWNAAWNTL